MLKTTMSGYEGFLRDSFTRLPETRERIAATSVTASWRYSGPSNYDESYEKALAALGAAFFGPASGGVYSPSLQFTLFEMGKGLLGAVPNAESVHLRLPNLHFLPCAPVNSTVGFFFFFFFLREREIFFSFLRSHPSPLRNHSKKNSQRTVRRRRLRRDLGAPRHDRGDGDAGEQGGAARQAVGFEPEQALKKKRRRRRGKKREGETKTRTRLFSDER